MAFNPDKWATSLATELRDYVLGEMGNWVTEVDGPAVYEVVMEYPSADAMTDKMPLRSTVIHFEFDDPRQVFFGLGDNITSQVVNEIAGTVEEWEAHCHEVDINVGVWASVESGGASARLEARQDLDRLFNGPYARERCMAVTEGVEILAFSGGQHVNVKIGDIPVYRIVDISLRVRVYSRTKRPPIEFIGGVLQEPGLTIDDSVEITV